MNTVPTKTFKDPKAALVNAKKLLDKGEISHADFVRIEKKLIAEDQDGVACEDLSTRGHQPSLGSRLPGTPCAPPPRQGRTWQIRAHMVRWRARNDRPPAAPSGPQAALAVPI
jgi:hypothetical protein